MPCSDTGEVFTAPISTALRFVNFRLPFSSFRYATGGQGQSKLDPSRLARLSVRYRPLCKSLHLGPCPEAVCLLAAFHEPSLAAVPVCTSCDGTLVQTFEHRWLAGLTTRQQSCPQW